MKRILIIDDDPDFCERTRLMLGDDFEVTAELTAAAGLRAVARESIDAVLLDVYLDGGADGLDVLGQLRQLDPDLPVIMVSRADDPSVIVDAGRFGATDFVRKGDSPEGLEFRLRKALELRRLAIRQELHAWRVAGEGGEEGDAWIAESAAARAVAQQLRQVAATDSPVLITGATGSGKEVVARALHAGSRLAAGPFVAVNCASIPEALAESTLFGHERGAFTGATSRRRGVFELAAGGTLFLDEFVEMRPDLQPKLLRVLESNEFQRVGAERTQRADVRVVTATNRDIELALADGSLREDIYYRLAVLTIHVPPLKQRAADILPLARHFAACKARAEGRPQPAISPEAAAVLASYEWPGNVRELRNVVERAVIFSSGEVLEPRHLTGLREGFRHLALPFEVARESVLGGFERDYVTALLTLTRGNVSEAAERMGMTRQGLHKILQKRGLDAEAFRAGAGGGADTDAAAADAAGPHAACAHPTRPETRS